MATIWVCPRTKVCGQGSCTGEVKPLKRPVSFDNRLINPEDGCVGVSCGMPMLKDTLVPKYVWSRQAVWGDFFKTGVAEKHNQSPKAVKVEGVQELLQPPSQIHEEPAEPSQIPEKPEECLKGIFCRVAGEKRPATHNDVVNFFTTPIFRSSKIIVERRKVILDFTTGEAVVKRGSNAVWKGTGEELRTIAQHSPLSVLKEWAAKSSK